MLKKIVFVMVIFFSFQFKSYSNSSQKSLLMKADLFKRGETQLIKNNIIFHFEKWLIKKEKESSFVIYFKNKEGQVIAEEKIILNEKGSFRYELGQFQVDQHAKFSLKKNSHLEMLYREGKESTINKLKWGKNFILPPMILDYVRDNYSAILKGPQEVELVIPNLQTNISFTFSLKTKEDPRCYKRASLCILFEPSSFLIRLFTESLYLYYDKDLQLIKASGPTLLYWREPEGGSLKPFFGDSYFNYK